MSIEKQIQSRIETFVKELSGLVRQAAVEAVATALGTGAAPVPARASRSRKASPAVAAAKPTAAKAVRTGSHKRTSAEDVQKLKDAVLKAAKSLKPGFAKRDVAEAAGLKVDISRILSLLVKDGKLAKKGDRRFTTYSVK